MPMNIYIYMYIHIYTDTCEHTNIHVCPGSYKRLRTKSSFVSAVIRINQKKAIRKKEQGCRSNNWMAAG